MGLQAKLIFQQDDCTELGRVVFNVKTVMFAFYDCVTSGNTDIIDSNLRFMTSTKFKLSLLGCDSQQMDIPGSILVQWHGFKKNVVGLSWGSDFINQINNFVDCFTDFECVWVHLFANLAFKSFPVEWSNILILGWWWFFLFLCKDPRF